MPTYQYACTDCAERIEVVQKFTDEPLLACSTCGGRLRKVFSPVGIVFKGSGFYRTDSRAGATKDKALNGSSENGSGSAGSSDSGSSSDAKKDGKSSGDKGRSSGDKKADKSAAGSSSSSSGSGSGSGASSSSGKSSSSSSGSKVA